MILQSLTNLYEKLMEQGKISPPGFMNCKVTFALSLSDEGKVVAVTECVQEVQSGKKTVLRPQEMQVPVQVKRASGIAPNFLCDTPAYILGFDNGAKPERTKKCFEESVRLHTEILENVNHPAARAVINFYRNGSQKDNPIVMEIAEQLIKGGSIVFRVNGKYAHDIPEIREAWLKAYNSSGDTNEQLCLITGKKTATARLHPNIKGVRNAQSSGASLVSFNAGAYESYGKEQGGNAPVGEYAAFAYGAALNYLLADSNHRQFIGDMTIVFWSEDTKTSPLQAFMAMSEGSSNREDISNVTLKASMKSLAEGKTIKWGDEELSPKTPFYILALAPNAARISVRFFLRNSFGSFAENMMKHYENLEIISNGDSARLPSFYSLLQETVNQNSKDKAASPVMAGEFMRAVLEDKPYPTTLLNGVNLRIRAEHKITRGRAAIIKAYYLKKLHTDCPKEVLTVELNHSKNIPYRLGRVFSVLEAIQQAANPGINSTILDKYFNSASATPAVVFPILVNLAQKHLKKMERGLSVHYQKSLTDILGDIGDKFPVRLTLPEQGSFQLGYYHQTQKRYEKKEKPENQEEKENA